MSELYRLRLSRVSNSPAGPYYKTSDDHHFCDDGLREFFVFSRARVIDLVAHDKPSVNRYPVKVSTDPWCPVLCFEYDTPSGVDMLTVLSCRGITRLSKHRVVYVQLEY